MSDSFPAKEVWAPLDPIGVSTFVWGVIWKKLLTMNQLMKNSLLPI